MCGYVLIVSACTSSCPSGSFLNTSRTCQKCIPGKYTNESNSTSCLSCLSGTYSPIPGMTLCSKCSAGHYQPQNSSTSCLSCPQGTFFNGTSASSCYLCTAGSTSKPGSSNCPFCLPGYFLNSSGLCQICTEGSCSTGGYQAFCLSCPAGFFAGVKGSSSCKECAEGSFNPYESQSFCSQCGNGNFSSKGSTGYQKDCLSCPAGKFTNSSSSSTCLNCPLGFWSNTVRATSSQSCKACPSLSNVFCDEGSSIPYVPQGFFRSLENPGEVTPCVPPAACFEAGFSNTTCDAAYSEVACSSCSSNYFRHNGICIKCLDKVFRWIILLLSATVLLFMLSQFSRHQSKIPVSIRLGLYWFQFLSLYPSLSNAWPPALLNVLNFTGIFNLDIGYLGVGCDIQNQPYFSILAVKILLPVIFFCVLISSSYLLSLRTKRSSTFKPLKALSQTIVVVNFFSVQILSSTLQVFNCVESGDGFRVLRQEPSIKCGASNWVGFVVFALIFFLSYAFALPLLVWRLHLKYQQKGSVSEMKLLSLPIGDSYRPGFEWFELVKLATKLGFVLVRDVFAFSSGGKMTFLMFLLLLMLCIESQVMPFAQKSHQSLSIL
jgi:hypothetical protein